MKKIEIDFHGRPLSIEMGKMAKQANGAAFVKYGETVVLVTAVCGRKNRDVDFLPLSVEYIEKFSAAGKIPGGFFKREGRQGEREILACRLTDRPLRPLFPEGYQRDTQIISTVLSYDGENDPDVLALLGASCALHVSDIPFDGPVAAVRVGRVEGAWKCNPTIEEMESGDIDLILAASKDAVTMVEGGANEVSESEMLDGLKFGFESVQALLKLQDEMREAIGKEKFSVGEGKDNSAMEKKVWEVGESDITKTMAIKEKIARYTRMDQLKAELCEKICVEGTDFEGKEGDLGAALHDLVGLEMRKGISERNSRMDERKNDMIRDITVEVGTLPRTHGSALFTRGETQALVTTTLGTSDDEQMIDSLLGFSKSNFMLHYNFPPFCVGETKPLRGPARREIGHGVLAHKSIKPMLPSKEDFPYTIRIVSDVLESHGSSSMATVCGATLSLMDAGVPMKAPVAGIAMGLIKEGDKFIVLSDISGDEDHIGDMDFKVAGSENGITAVQMDIKIKGISWDILEQALSQAKDGRLHILSKMTAVIDQPRTGMSEHAPRIETIKIDKEKIRDVIGSGGKVIRSIVEKSGAKVEVSDEGEVKIASSDGESLEIARKMIEGIVAEAEVGKVYQGKVTRVMEYGAFVEILPGKEGLCHVSEFMTTEPIRDASEVVSEGDEIEVKVLAVEPPNRIKLSHREVIEPGSSDFDPEKSKSDRGDRGRGPRGRGGDKRNGSRNRY